MYKLFAIDLDQTLLNSKKEISPKNLQAIAKAIEAGIVVTAATGRSYAGSKFLMDQMGISQGPVINYGGAQVVMYPTDEVLVSETLDMDIVEKAIQFGKEFNVHIQVYEGDSFYYESYNEHVKFYESHVKYTGTETNLDEFPFKRVAKVLYCASPERITEIKPILNERFGDRVNVLQSLDNLVELHSKNATKGSALKALAEKLGIKREETIAIGDSGIDIPMIKYAGLGIAVDNATDDVKQAADYIAPDCDHDAIWHVVEKFIL